MAALIVIFAAMVPSHQLTPFVALVTTAALVVFRRSDARGLPTLMAVLIAAWVVFMTVAYLSGHIEKITGSVGTSARASGRTSRPTCAARPTTCSSSRSRLAPGRPRLWGMAGLGFWRLARRPARHRRSGSWRPRRSASCRSSPTAASCSCASSSSRCPSWRSSRPRSSFAAGAARGPAAHRGRLGRRLLGLIGAFLVARYGNERMDAFTSDEVSAVQVAYDVVPRDAVLMAGGTNTPWKFERYRDVHHKVLLADPVFRQQEPSALRPGPLADAVAASLRRAAGKRTASYLLLMRSQDAGASSWGPSVRACWSASARPSAGPPSSSRCT